MGVEDVEAVVESLQHLKIDPISVLDPKDPTFLVEPEFRPTSKHNDFFESQIPVVDLSAVRSADEEGVKRAVEEIGKAAEEWGFFQVVNHGVPLSLIDTLQEESLKFFSLPLEEKKHVLRTLDKPVGYFHQELTKNRKDWKEVFDYVVRESVAYQTEDGESDYILQNQWPGGSPGLRDICLKYAKATEALAFELLGLISRSLGLPAEYFHRHFTNHTASIRLNYYPPCPISSLALGVSRHRDPGALTVLLQDEVGGLQVRRKDGEWIGVRPRRDAFVINLGDLFQVWSNDKFRSVEHRVVVNESKARFSCPLFFNPDSKTDVFPVPELLDEDHPPKYTSYNHGYFMRKRSDGNYRQQGRDIQIDDFAVNRS